MYLRTGRCLLRVHRRRKKIKQHEIAERLRVSISMVSQIENDLKMPNYEVAKNIAELLGIPMDELYEWTPDKQR